MRMLKFLCLAGAFFFCAIPYAPAADGFQTPGNIWILTDCIRAARTRHPSLQTARADFQASLSRITQARSGYYPQAAWSNTYTRAYDATATDHTGDQYTSELTLSQTLLDFGRTAKAVRIQTMDSQSAQASLEAQDSQVVYAVKEAYYATLKARQDEKAYTQALNQYQHHLESAQKFFAVGMKARFDVTKAAVDLSQARLKLLQARNASRLCLLKLKNSMGMPQAPDFALQEETTEPEPPAGLGSAIQAGYAARPELHVVQKQTAAAQAALDLSRAGIYPELSAGGRYGKTGEDFPLKTTWSVGADLSVPLFTGFSTTAKIDEARANLMLAQANEELQRQGIRLEIEQAFYTLSEASERIQVARLGMRQATENRELAEGRYQAGVGNALEVTDALTAEITANTSYSQAMYDYRLAKAALAKAMGVKTP